MDKHENDIQQKEQAMTVSVKKIAPDSRDVLENLFSYYLYDMSAYVALQPDSHGRYVAPPHLLAPYWFATDHIPYFICLNERPVGFALVRRYPVDRQYYDMDQFFVLRSERGKGIGSDALARLVQLHSGQWQIRVLQENHQALAFWSRAVERIVAAEYTLSIETDVDLAMHFLRFQFPAKS